MAGQSDNGATPLRSSFVDVPAGYRSMASFLGGLRDGEPEAMRAFYMMYAPLLRDQARRMMLRDDERDDLVATVLGDVLLHLIDTDLPPRDLTRYVVGAFRNRARNEHRDRTRRGAREERAYSAEPAGAQRIVAECHSAYGLATAHGAAHDSDPVPLSAAITKLARYSAQAMGPDDAQLMIGISRHIPLRDLAAQAGLSYGAARVRVHRLREKFTKLMPRYVAALEPDERREMERFLRRAGVALHDATPAAGPPAPRSRPTSAARDGEETTA